MRRPEATEFDAYYGRYVDLVPEGDILDILGQEMVTTQALLASVPPELEEHRYAAGKWSVREVVGHLVDVERMFAFRCLWVARGAEGAQPAFDQDAWAASSNAGRRRLADLAEEWVALRRDDILLFRSLDDEAWARVGIASGRSFTARSFPWIIAGHERYHRERLVGDYGLGGAR
jgi:uncharacterized damage-inducible protein DinB